MTVWEGPRLRGLVVTYRRADALEAMLHALSSQTRVPDQLLVVDNDPAGSAADVVAATPFPRPVEYVAAGDNLGPAGGIALGMERMLPACDDDDWLLLLDDDDPPAPDDLLERIFALAISRASPQVAAVGAVGSRFDLRRGRLVRVPDEELHGPVAVDVIAGNQFPMYRVAAVRAVGTFTPDLFFGFEELDFCLRLRAAGYTLLAHGDVWQVRRRNRPTPYVGRRLQVEEPSWRRYYSLRNLIQILRRRGHPWAALRVTVTRGLLKPLLNLVVSPRLAARNLRLNMAASVHAWRGKMGRTVEPEGAPVDD